VTALSALRPDSLRARIDDWMNPIVVKELRQAVQSRFVVAALLGLLCTQLIAIGVYLVASPNSVIDIDAGRQVFMVLYGIQLFLCMLFVPLYTAIRLVAERSDTNVDLLFITTIKPRSIIAGKLFSAIILTILIFSACLPFMAFTYFLRGIDLPSIFIVLALGFIIVIACTQLSIFVAAIPVNRVFKLLFGVLALWFIFLTFLSAMAAVNGMFQMGIGSRFGDWDFWKAVLGILSFFGLVTGSFFVLSVALITPQAANRALPVRVFITSAWVFLFVAALIINLFEKNPGPIILWHLVFNSIFAIALFAGVSERDRLGRRVLRSVPQSALKRILAFFFFSGAASGVIWASTGICLTLALAWAWTKLFPNYSYHNDLIDSLKWAGAMCLYLFCYAMSGALLRRHLLSRVASEVTWLIGMILMILGIVVPVLTGYLLFFDDEWWNTGYQKWLAGNPFAWGKEQNQILYLGVAAVWAFIAAALNLRWFINRARDFRGSRVKMGQVIVEVQDA
jgi:hypothetical protein